MLQQGQCVWLTKCRVAKDIVQPSAIAWALVERQSGDRGGAADHLRDFRWLRQRHINVTFSPLACHEQRHRIGELCIVVAADHCDHRCARVVAYRFDDLLHLRAFLRTMTSIFDAPPVVNRSMHQRFCVIDHQQ